MRTLTETLQIALNEHLGAFEGLRDICEYCAKQIYAVCNNDDKDCTLIVNKRDLDSMPKVFFNKIKFNIIFTDTDRIAEYEPTSKLDRRTLLFNEININIYINYNEELEPYKICGALMHELTHAYTDYQLQLKGTDYFNNLANFYQKVEYDDNIEDMRNQIRQALYLTLGVEKQAFLAQFEVELELSKQPLYTPIDAMEVLRKTDVYSFYCDMRNYLDEYNKGNIEQEAIDIITDEYNEVSGTHLTSNKVFKKLEFLIKKAIKKFDDVIRKLCFERFA